jgi:hypothetical protein
LFAWRRQARREADGGIGGLPFARVMVETTSAPAPSVESGAETKSADTRPHVIEPDVEGSSVWIWPGAESAMATAIIGALKAAKGSVRRARFGC